jgi:plasmid stability protein
MATLTLNDLDDRIVDALKHRAQANARSIEAEAEEILAQGIGDAPLAADKWEIAGRIAAMTPKNVPQTDSVIMLREDRER